MARLGPFEPAPRVAVGVSGGADSLALCLLLDGWARACGGDVLALTVDHGLRPEAAAEAAAVGALCAARGIAHAILRVDAPPSAAGLQAWARRHRHGLLEAACAARGILHLALAHHGDDQAETLLLRLSRGSGPDGLAGMAALRETGAVRILRPLLAVSRDRLEATCRDAGVGWASDPSNVDPRFARARLRAVTTHLAGEGMTAASLGAVAVRAGRVRALVEDMVTATLARAARLHEAGFVILDPAALAGVDREIAVRVLRAALATAGSADRPAREEAVARLLDGVLAGEAGPGTLAGARIFRWRGRIVVCREPAAVGPPISLPVAPGVSGTTHWDYRFQIRGAAAHAGLTIGALGPGGPAKDRAEARALPGPVRAALPAFRQGGEVIAIPHLRWWAAGPVATSLRAASVLFVPRVPLSHARFVAGQDVV
jgi:tRNA(Ile)-lysidine synthase